MLKQLCIDDYIGRYGFEQFATKHTLLDQHWFKVDHHHGVETMYIPASSFKIVLYYYAADMLS